MIVVEKTKRSNESKRNSFFGGELTFTADFVYLQSDIAKRFLYYIQARPRKSVVICEILTTFVMTFYSESANMFCDTNNINK